MAKIWEFFYLVPSVYWFPAEYAACLHIHMQSIKTQWRKIWHCVLLTPSLLMIVPGWSLWKMLHCMRRNSDLLIEVPPYHLYGKNEANQSSYYGYGNNQHQRNTQRHLAISNDADIAFLQDVEPGCMSSCCWAGGWLAWIEPQKKNKLACWMFSSSQSERSNHPKNSQMLEETLWVFIYHIAWYSFLESTSAFATQKILRFKECGFIFSSVDTDPGFGIHICESQSADDRIELQTRNSLPRGLA